MKNKLESLFIDCLVLVVAGGLIVYDWICPKESDELWNDINERELL